MAIHHKCHQLYAIDVGGDAGEISVIRCSYSCVSCLQAFLRASAPVRCFEEKRVSLSALAYNEAGGALIRCNMERSRWEIGVKSLESSLECVSPRFRARELVSQISSLKIYLPNPGKFSLGRGRSLQPRDLSQVGLKVSDFTSAWAPKLSGIRIL